MDTGGLSLSIEDQSNGIPFKNLANLKGCDETFHDTTNALFLPSKFVVVPNHGVPETSVPHPSPHTDNLSRWCTFRSPWGSIALKNCVVPPPPPTIDPGLTIFLS